MEPPEDLSDSEYAHVETLEELSGRRSVKFQPGLFERVRLALHRLGRL
jgi:hypothetical protein